jgi:hypothetical protein
MIKNNDRVIKMEDALITAHRSRPEIEPDAEWNTRGMAQVREEGPLGLTNNRYPALAQIFVWRFAAVVCSLALVISFYAFKTGIGTEQFMLEFFSDDPLATLTMILLPL